MNYSSSKRGSVGRIQCERIGSDPDKYRFTGPGGKAADFFELIPCLDLDSQQKSRLAHSLEGTDGDMLMAIDGGLQNLESPDHF
jgi:hypothetical protein